MTEHDGRRDARDPADLGDLIVDGDTATMTFRRRMPHPIDAVWAALTDPGERAAWFGQTTIDGGVIDMRPDDPPDGPPAAPEAKLMTGRILAWEPPVPGADGRRVAVLEHEWRQRIVDDGVVRYELTEDGDGTVLEFSHRGLSLGNARGFIPGMHAYLDRLAAHLAGAEPPGWVARYEELVPAYAGPVTG